MNNLIEKRLKLINASAGSGKTTQLVNRLLGILSVSQNPSKVCATTFTRKAASEINARLFRLIANVVKGEASSSLSLETAKQLLLLMTVEGKAPRIATIDSFFSEAARCFSLELGLPIDWQIVPESEGRELLAELSDELMQSGDRMKMGTLVRILKNDRAIRSFHENLISEIEKGISLWRQVPADDRIDVWKWREIGGNAGRDTNLLIDDLEEVDLPRTSDGKKVNSYFQNAVQSLVFSLQHEDPREALKNGLVKAVISKKLIFSKKEIASPLLDLIEEAVASIRFKIAQQSHYKCLALYELMSTFDSAYSEKVRDLGQLSYDDLKLVLSSGFSQDWADLLSVRLDSKFDHLLFDEFQDTSLVQWNYFKGFTEEIISQRLPDRSVFVVGDKKQSIYGWRGGVKKLFDLVTEEIRAAGGSIESIAKNYRSSPAVIKFVNQVFENLLTSELAIEYREQSERWLRDFSTHEASKSELAGEVKVFHAKPEDSIQKVVSLTKSLLSNPKIEEIGILVKTNKELRQLAKIFDKEGVSVSQEGGAPLENEPLCLALVNLLQLVDHPGDTAAALIVASSIIGSVLKFNDHFDPTQRIKLAKEIRNLIEVEGAYSALSSLLAPLRNQLTPRELNVLDEILEVILAKESRIGPRVSKLIPILRKHKFERATGGRARLLTSHTAKGLEFDVVILTELSDSIFGKRAADYLVDQPDELKPPERIVRFENKEIRELFPDLERIHQQQKAKRYEESLSVLYVSLTRAKRGLALIFEDNEKRDHSSFQTILTQIIKPQMISIESGETLSGMEGSIFPRDLVL